MSSNGDELRTNLKALWHRLRICRILLGRRFRPVADPRKSDWGYDEHYARFWERGDLFRAYPYVRDGVPVQMTPLDYKRECIVTILTEIIHHHDFRNILEVGSGAGLNLLFLAPRFPATRFTGLEPAQSGVAVAEAFLGDPPEAFTEARAAAPLRNVRCLVGNILDPASYTELAGERFDFVYSSAVLEQLQDHLDLAFRNIFALADGHFLFFEEWLEANQRLAHYCYLVINNYFRVSWDYLRGFPEIEILHRSIPTLQPSWLQYGVVHCRKITPSSSGETIVRER